MAKPFLSLFIFSLVLAAAVLGIYLPGWNHGLVFDDLRLNDDAIFGRYGSLLDFKQRMLSYGSFVWIDALTGSRWGLQRLLNIALHLHIFAGAAYAFVAVRLCIGAVVYIAAVQQLVHFAVGAN